jgi:hypothetical protein
LVEGVLTGFLLFLELDYQLQANASLRAALFFLLKNTDGDRKGCGLLVVFGSFRLNILLFVAVDQLGHEPLSRLFVNKLHSPALLVDLNLADSRQGLLVLDDANELLEDVVGVVIGDQLEFGSLNLFGNRS